MLSNPYLEEGALTGLVLGKPGWMIIPFIIWT